ncbi:aldo/keto reductase [Streptomyces sp. NPDC006743]|uniref:aldo/keto reductase n=1 Tax=Streptomyces sp. NPDC006743 TaxID=3154480 RepID=UPI003451B097
MKVSRVCLGTATFVVAPTVQGAARAVRSAGPIARGGCAPTRLRLAWLLSRPAGASVIVGADVVDEFEANISAADIALEPDPYEVLTALTA